MAVVPPGQKHHIQRDWEQREFVEMVSINVKKITNFLNNFSVSTSYRLAKINERLSQLERQVDYLEAALHTADANATVGVQAPAE